MGSSNLGRDTGASELLIMRKVVSELHGWKVAASTHS
jgi:hypothetical protein